MTATTPDLAAPPRQLNREELQRRSSRVLVTSQVLSGAGLGAGITLGALLAEDMLRPPPFSATRLVGGLPESAAAGLPVERTSA